MAKRELEFERAVLVYQAGIANVFSVKSFDLRKGEDRGEARLLQHAFRSCEDFARGLAAAGVTVRVASCNQAGDIALHDWTPGLDDCPFRDSAHPNTSWIPGYLAVA